MQVQILFHFTRFSLYLHFKPCLWSSFFYRFLDISWSTRPPSSAAISYLRDLLSIRVKLISRGSVYFQPTAARLYLLSHLIQSLADSPTLATPLSYGQVCEARRLRADPRGNYIISAPLLFGSVTWPTAPGVYRSSCLLIDSNREGHCSIFFHASTAILPQLKQVCRREWWHGHHWSLACIGYDMETYFGSSNVASYRPKNDSGLIPRRLGKTLKSSQLAYDDWNKISSNVYWRIWRVSGLVWVFERRLGRAWMLVDLRLRLWR